MLRCKQTSVPTENYNSCLHHSLYWWFTLNIHMIRTLHIYSHTGLSERCIVLEWWGHVGSVLWWVCVCLTVWTDCHLRRDGWARRSVQGVWKEGWKGSRGRREGCVSTCSPSVQTGTDIQSTSDLALPPTEHVVLLNQWPWGKHAGVIVVYRAPPTWSPSCWSNCFIKRFPV